MRDTSWVYPLLLGILVPAAHQLLEKHTPASTRATDTEVRGLHGQQIPDSYNGWQKSRSLLWLLIIYLLSSSYFMLPFSPSLLHSTLFPHTLISVDHFAQGRHGQGRAGLKILRQTSSVRLTINRQAIDSAIIVTQQGERLNAECIFLSRC